MTERNSLERVLALLDVFTEDRLEWTPEELMAELGYSRPTLYRYLKTLRDAGYLTSLPNSGFTLGPKVVEMDFLMRKSDTLVQNSQPYLELLSAAHSCTALLVRWYGNKLLCVASECATPDPVSSYPRGRPMPLARGAISRAVLAFLPRKKAVALIEDNLDELSGIGQGGTVEEVLDNLRVVRRRGFANARGEVTNGVIGIAAPVFDSGHSPVAVLCTTIPQPDLDDEAIDTIGAQVRDAAKAISDSLAQERAESPPARGVKPDTMTRKQDTK